MNKSLEIVQGSSFEWLMLILDVNKRPLDMTGYPDPRGDIKADYGEAVAASFDLTVLDESGVLALVASGDLVLSESDVAKLVGDSNGKCYLLAVLTADNTALLDAQSYVYDIEVENPAGRTIKPYRGTIQIQPEATELVSSI